METGEEGVRMRKVIKALVVVALVNAAATTIGRLISKQNSAGDEDSADFRRMVMFGGEEFKSKAIALRSGAVTVRGGGISTCETPASIQTAPRSTSTCAAVGPSCSCPRTGSSRWRKSRPWVASRPT